MIQLLDLFGSALPPVFVRPPRPLPDNLTLTARATVHHATARRWLAAFAPILSWILLRCLNAARARAGERVAGDAGGNWRSTHQRSARLASRESLLTDGWCVVFDGDPSALSVTGRAAKVLAATFEFYNLVATDALSQDKEGQLPLDMEPYKALFSISLVAGADRDRLRRGRGHHVLVLVLGITYAVDAVIDGDLRTTASWVAVLDAVVADASARGTPSGFSSPAVATAGNRDAWARVARSLDEAALEIARDAILALSLDVDDRFEDEESFGRHAYAHGFENRWYDLSLQIVVSADARAAVVGNFRAGVEGRVAWRLVSFVPTRALELEIEDEEPARMSDIAHRRLEWGPGLAAVDGELRTTRSLLTARLTATPSVFWVPWLGRALFKELGVRPDGGFLLALRMATRRVAWEGLRPNVIEMIDMRHYAGGHVRVFCPPTDGWDRVIDALPSGDTVRIRRLLADADRIHRHAIAQEKEMADDSMIAVDTVVMLTDYAASRMARLFMRLLTQLVFNPWGTFPLITSNIRFAPSCAFHGPIGYSGAGPSIAVYVVLKRDKTLVTFQAGGGLGERARQLGEALSAVARELAAFTSLETESEPSNEP